MTEKIALSVTEAAEFLGVSRPTMYKLINRDDFSADFRVGTRRLIHREKLMEWAAAQTEDGERKVSACMNGKSAPA